MRTDATQRFWSKVAVAGNDECWLWTASVNNKGYGRLWLDGMLVCAHRFAYVLAYGDIPAGLFVCHKCDNPRCCNPNHLFLGTQADNIRDMVEKGRHTHACLHGDKNGSRLHPETRPRGENHPDAKLTTKQVARIRDLFATGNYTKTTLGRMFGVSRTQIYRVVIRRSWKDGADV